VLGDIRWIDIAHSDDERGTLTAIEEAALPFPIRRVFYMHRVRRGQERGAHAHRFTQQGIIAVAGSFRLDVADGTRTETYLLDDPNRCLYLPPLTWTRLHAFEPTTVALVLCDTPYHPEHVVRSWEDYQRLVRERASTGEVQDGPRQREER
jgi:dTDP-4-dehydrorhamnose 3,5-epimerase-like enzyme